jgi:hypothetical protein
MGGEAGKPRINGRDLTWHLRPAHSSVGAGLVWASPAECLMDVTQAYRAGRDQLLSLRGKH